MRYCRERARPWERRNCHDLHAGKLQAVDLWRAETSAADSALDVAHVLLVDQLIVTIAALR
jgi:hypothetical protein